MSVYRITLFLKKSFYKLFIENGLKGAFGQCGKHVKVARDSEFFPEKNIYIGNNVSIGPYALFWSLHAKIQIEDNVLIGPRVTIVTGDHRSDIIGKHIIDVGENEKKQENDQDVIIENGAWIGANVTILKGVRIGTDAIIAAGSVVTKNVDPYSVFGGVPAKKIKDRFSKNDQLRHIMMLNENTENSNKD